MQRAVNAGIVLVIAAGNDATADPDPFALTPAQQFRRIGNHRRRARRPTTRPIASFSDKAGIGAEYYLMAVGVDDRAPDQTGTQYLWSGTSFSAPTISGAVALMAQAFPNLTGKQIVEILFNSADDLGATGVDSTYGHGALDIARAFAPQGATAMADSKTPVGGCNGDLPRRRRRCGRAAVDGCDHPRRLQPCLCDEPRQDAAPRRGRSSAVALAAERCAGRRRQRRAGERSQ